MTKHAQDNPLRAARAAVFAGKAIPALVAEQLVARGIDPGELEQRFRQNQEWRR
jgi:hypothetical protein